jgi:PAS domain S-box-containing protein
VIALPGLLVVTPPGPDADALCASLVDRGFEVHVAGSGEVAYEVASRRMPDAILMNPTLSAMDRWHAVKRLNTAVDTARIPVLTMGADAGTALGLERVLAKIHRAIGAVPVPDQVPTAPIPLRRPRRALDVEATPRTGDSRAAEPLRPPPSTPGPTPGYAPPRTVRPRTYRILVVDDHPVNRDLLLKRLEKTGYAVTLATSGEEALQLLADDAFDLVILDWMMPAMSGIEVLRRIRATRTPIELPVIMATARSEPDDIVEALRAEANDYVTKPLNFEIVLARIRSQLGLAEAHRELAASERRFRALLENTGDLILQFRPGGDVLYVSPASRTLLGVAPEELARRSFYDWLHPIDRRALEAHLRDHVHLPRAYSFIARMQAQDGRWLWIETSVRVLHEGGAVVHQAACRDVTEHMDGLAGDEPPLPLGGDVMAHPGWRAQTSRAPAPDRVAAAPGVATGSSVVIATVTVERPGVKAEMISQRVTEAVRRALREVDDG